MWPHERVYGDSDEISKHSHGIIWRNRAAKYTHPSRSYVATEFPRSRLSARTLRLTCQRYKYTDPASDLTELTLLHPLNFSLLRELFNLHNTNGNCSCDQENTQGKIKSHKQKTDSLLGLQRNYSGFLRNKVEHGAHLLRDFSSAFRV